MQEDMQKGVHGRFMDQSTSVREAAVELVGRFILNKPELTHQYYEMIMERILVYENSKFIGCFLYISFNPSNAHGDLNLLETITTCDHTI